jgi:glycosyltransferase involved in cell wall biosynthesis
MKIAYFYLTGDTSLVLYPKRHDGGGCFGRYAKQLLNNDENEFWTFAPKEAFKDACDEDYMKRCVFLTQEDINFLKGGGSVAKRFPQLLEFDILVHNEDYFAFNVNDSKLKQVVWLGYVNQTMLPQNHAGLYYSQDQKFYYHPAYTKIYKIKIGKYVPSQFNAALKEDFIFSCTRNDFLMNTNEIIKMCNKLNIKGYFAGPICGSENGGVYDILSHIDNKNTFYLGQISEGMKLDMGRRARLYNCAQNWDTIFSLSAIEALSTGTPLLAYNRGCFKYLIKNGINGFYYDGTEADFLRIWNESKTINQENCWLSAKEYSHEEMVRTFYDSFKDILKS